ncbi:hypothetical protein J0A68_11330 [Algoriphagus sp. H41]|uniref:Outer membrane protein beta-barrel domain-containing protein n=1 Tax=Algoriphagus oliviformis TaxID=2811231 RepID=A0ABS3C3V3_9BACT|nr:hypothetical protein [Algoriphagus oliviformis]MBN7811545.1 hypothetical protein [Algoriphagus oliviformis]
MKRLLIGIICLSAHWNAFSQNSFGLEFGQVDQNSFGNVNQIGNVIVEPIGGGTTTTRIFGLFYEREISNRLSLHNKVTYSRVFTRYYFYDNSKPVFPNVPGLFEGKVGGPPVGRLSLEILPQFTLLEVGKIRLNAFGGVNLSANIVKEQADEFHRGLPELSTVYNSFETSQMPFTANFAFGGSIEYARRIVFWAKYQPTSYYSREIEVEGKKYPFENRWNFLSMTMGYRFYSFRFKKKDDS